MFGEEDTLPRWTLRTSVDGTPFEVIATHFHMAHEDSEHQMINMVELGLACTLPRPENHPTMNEVVKILQRISNDKTTRFISVIELIQSTT
ncbi:hypothetical protein SUGI_0040340 [Cryptomeria japonica]|nr:hypothetical protein SUGI_0040340 [Cryptomeria japonica]